MQYIFELKRTPTRSEVTTLEELLEDYKPFIALNDKNKPIILLKSKIIENEVP